MNLSEENSRLSRQAEELNKQIEELNMKLKELEEKNEEQQLVIEEQKQFIIELKSHINPEPVKTEAQDWINSLTEKNFEKAFLKSSSLCSFWGNNWTPRMFTNYFVKNIENIKLISSEEDQEPLVEIIPYQTPDFNVKVVMHAHVSLTENAVSEYLQEGENIIELDFTYSDRHEQWVIMSVSSEPVENPDLQDQAANDESISKGSE